MKVFVSILSWLSITVCFGADWKPVSGTLLTPYGQKLDVSSVWQEYPRPQLRREKWSNLNGLWNYAIIGLEAGKPETWDGEILVPFCPESALSGVGKLLEPDQALWYQRELAVKPVSGKRTLLHFEAADYRTTVWVNGVEVGKHVGGHTPFAFDITSALKADGNRLMVRVEDATEGYQLRGKQMLKPYGITASRVSGIWQTVWLEEVPERFIAELDYGMETREKTVAPGKVATATMLKVKPKLAGKALKNEKVRVTVSYGGKTVATGQGAGELAIEIPEPKLWSPDSPSLYDVKAELLNAKGKPVDTVESYTALRQVSKIIDAQGQPKLALNGKEIFLLGPLDQGWWPDGLLTPPSEEAMLADLKFLKAAGFNMVRKHVKVEPARFYYHCDRLGLAVWQDQVNAGLGPKDPPLGASPNWIRLRPDPQDAVWPDDAHQQWVTEYKAMVDHLRDYPSILIWCPFNEAWGQHRTMEIGQMAKEYDPTRLVCIASGGNFWPVGDIASQHNYPNPRFPMDDPRFRDFIKVAGEMGGYGLPLEGHRFESGRKDWSYRTAKSLDEWQSFYRSTLEELMPLRAAGLSAAVYTQTSDFENEVNGFQSYDRFPKVDPAWLKPLNERVISGEQFARSKR
jgi:beta-galactosidase